MMQANKRLGTESSATRAALIEATDQLIREEGYGSVTSRRLAEKAGLKHQLIYYYFNTLGDLLLEVFQRASERNIAHLEQALNAEHPLRALWEHNSDPRSIRFMTEFTAMGNHHEAIRTALAAHGERVRATEARVIGRYLEDRKVDVGLPPKVLTILISSVSRSMLIERNLGMTFGHKEMQEAVYAWLETVEAPEPPAADAPRRAVPWPGRRLPNPRKVRG
jgi:AcrR family transcriptional regulator